METARLEKWIEDLQGQIDVLTRKVKNLEAANAHAVTQNTTNTTTSTTKKARTKE